MQNQLYLKSGELSKSSVFSKVKTLKFAPIIILTKLGGGTNLVSRGC